MAGPAQNVVNETTGETGSVAPEQLARAQAAGARNLSDEESAALIQQHEADHDVSGMAQAAGIGAVRGLGEAFATPVDALATGIGGEFGHYSDTRDYLNDLQKWHPYASAGGELVGQVGGALAGGELMEGAEAATAATRGGRIAQSIGRGAVRGGLENMVIGSTHDVNERALGNPDAAGEKLLPDTMKHFLVGAIAGGVLGGIGSGITETAGAFKKPLSEALDRQASAAVGREVGGGLAEGAAIRARMGHVPSSTSELADFLSKEQTAFREGAARQSAAARDALESAQTTAAWQQSAKNEATRLATAKEAKAAVAEVEARNATAREAMLKEHASATESFEKLAAERDAARAKLKGLAGELDRVKGAELPNAQNIVRDASEAFSPAQSLTPPSPRAQALFQEWADNFAKKYGEHGKLTFSELQDVIESLNVMEKRQRVVSGWGNDAEVSAAFKAMKNSARAEFDRASAVTADGISDAKGLSAARLRQSLPDLDRAVADAKDTVDNLTSTIKSFDRAAAQEVKQAQREGFQAIRSKEKLLRKEDSIFDANQRAELRGLPKPSKATPVDKQLEHLRGPQGQDAIGLTSIGGAAMSLLHGNVAGAAMAALGGIAARTAKAQGNMIAARTMSALADSIAKADGTIARYAGRAVGRYARLGTDLATEDKGPARPRMNFEKVYQRVRDAQTNPLIVEQRVRASAGQWAQTAPTVYSSLLSASMRAQSFLESKLPPPRTDPYSLTPQIEESDLSDTEKYDFMQYTKAVADPIGVLKDVADGSVTEQQVEALQAVYPALYKQMATEVMRRVAELDAPLDYEKSVHIGTLLNIDTSEVMTSEFQSVLADMYSAREENEKPPGGSQPRGVNSRLSKSMASEGQQMQMGDQ